MKDLTGQRFGRLTALEPTDRRVRQLVVWRCKCDCDCGNTCTVASYQLTSGRTRSCGCLRGEAIRNDLAGRRFGRLTALRPAGKRHGYILWECACDCGGSKLVTSQQLTGGKTRSCGCLAKERPAKDLAGKRFGKLTAVRRAGSRGGYAVWGCACDCGGTCEVTSRDLAGGFVKSCGCLRGA